MLQGKRGGYFVDLAANDALIGSNSLLLEASYGWRGLCVEANSRYFWDLAQRSCALVAAVVGGTTNSTVRFHMNPAHPSRSAIVGAVAPKGGKRKGGGPEVEPTPFSVVRLEEILDAAGAPDVIDFLSLDIEGSEEAALRGFPWHRYAFATLSVENPTAPLQGLLERHGYRFVRTMGEDKVFIHAETLGLARVAQIMAKHRDETYERGRVKELADEAAGGDKHEQRQQKVMWQARLERELASQNKTADMQRAWAEEVAGWNQEVDGRSRAWNEELARRCSKRTQNVSACVEAGRRRQRQKAVGRKADEVEKRRQQGELTDPVATFRPPRL